MISAIFGSQTRNVLTCLKCSENKTIFEVFNYFSIPIPETYSGVNFSVTIVPRNTRSIIKIAITVNQSDPIEIFLSKIQNKSGIYARNLIFGFAKNGKLHECFQPITINDILIKSHFELFAFEIITSLDEAEKEGKMTTVKEISND